MCVWPDRKAGRSIVVPVLFWLEGRKEDMEVGSGEKEKEVPLQHSECQGDLRLVSSSRVSRFSNAGPGSLSSRVIFTIIILSEEETFCPR